MRSYAHNLRVDSRALMAKSRAFRVECARIKKAGARLTGAAPFVPLEVDVPAI